MAEGVFRHLLSGAGIEHLFEVSSAGTVCHQKGEPPDYRAVRVAGRHGIDISGLRARCIHDLDLHEFDWVFAMDSENYRDVLDWFDRPSPVRVHMMADFAGSYTDGCADSGRGCDIEDPWYGSERDFETVMRQLLLAAEGIVRFMRETCFDSSSHTQDEGRTGIIREGA